jgi:rod shape-determining protein MreD
VTPGARAPLRIALLVLLFVIVQVSGLAAMRVLGGTPDVVPLLVAAVALYGGAVPATITGFFAGLLVDLAVGANLGAAALVLTAVGYGGGRTSHERPTP